MFGGLKAQHAHPSGTHEFFDQRLQSKFPSAQSRFHFGECFAWINGGERFVASASPGDDADTRRAQFGQSCEPSALDMR